MQFHPTRQYVEKTQVTTKKGPCYLTYIYMLIKRLMVYEYAQICKSANMI